MYKANANSHKREIDNNTIIVGEFNSPLKPMERSSRQKLIRKHKPNNRLDKIDLIDIYRTFHPKAAEYTYFSSTHGTFSMIDHILGYKSSLGKFKKIEIILSILSNHNSEIRNQLQEKQNCKKHKKVEVQQYVTKQPMNHWRNQRGNQKILKGK